MPYLHIYPLGRNALAVPTDDRTGDLKKVAITTRGFITQMSVVNSGARRWGLTVYDEVIVHTR